jgi:hypothetical protein
VVQHLLIAIGESDCEHIGSGFLAQPMNAISSLAFVLIGFAIWLSANRNEGQERVSRWVFGGLLVATGIGSVLFHGPQGPASHFLHDATFLVALVTLVVLNLAGVFGWDSQRKWMILAVSSGVSVVILLVWPTSTNIIAGVAVLALVGVDISIHRSSSVHQRWWIASIVTMGFAVAVFVLGRTGGPLCDSESIFQGHALWHILSAIALWAYFEATTPARLGVRQ